MARSYFEGLVLFFLGVPTLLVIVVFFDMALIYALGDSILRRVVPLFRSSVDDRYVSRDITNVYYLDFLIGTFFDKMALLSVL